MAPFHTMLIRGVVRTGLVTLPSRESFLQSIGETEESALPHVKDVVAAAEKLVAAVQQLLKGVNMPVSDVWFWPS